MLEPEDQIKHNARVSLRLLVDVQVRTAESLVHSNTIGVDAERSNTLEGILKDLKSIRTRLKTIQETKQ